MPDHTRLAHRFAEILNTRDLDAFDDLVALDYVNHNPYVKPGLQGVKEFFAHWLDAFPDAHVTVEDALAAGDRVAGRFTYRGTHRGAFLGHAPTGNAIVMRSIDIWRVQNEQFVEHWDELNLYELMQQVGAIPSAS